MAHSTTMTAPGQPELCNKARMLDKCIPPDTRQLFLPLYAKTSATLLLRTEGYYMAGISETTPGFLIDRIPEFQLYLFTIAGNGHMSVAGQEFDLAPGTLFIAPDHTRQHYVQQGTETWRFLWFHRLVLDSSPAPGRQPRLGAWHHAVQLENAMVGFFTETMSVLQGNVALGDAPPWVYYQDAEKLDVVLHRFHLHLDHSGANAETIAELHAQLILKYLERELLAIEHQLANDDRHQSLNELWAQVSRRLADPWNLAEMARCIHVSIPTLIRQVRRIYESTPRQMLYLLRLKYAAQLLLTTQLAIEDIASEVGYDAAGNFCTALKREYHVTPLQYRHRNLMPE